MHAGNPWELARPIRHEIKFGGSCVKGTWKPGFVVYARAYDNPIPGWKTRNCGNLRLWDALPAEELDLDVRTPHPTHTTVHCCCVCLLQFQHRGCSQ